MFERKTVFILGAGASWHYCYPTGEQLVLDIITMAKDLRSECQRQMTSHWTTKAPAFAGAENQQAIQEYWRNLEIKCEDLIRRLETVRPLVIDYFLGWNPSLREIGKLLIAAVMLKCEAEYHSAKTNLNRRRIAEQSAEVLTPEVRQRLNIGPSKDNWYRFITHKLASRCVKSKELFDNKVHFVTFNYDHSLEDHLLDSLHSIDTFTDEHVEQFISRDRIVHVYGCIRKKIASSREIEANGFLTESSWSWVGNDNPAESKWISFLEGCEAASCRIRTIDSHDKVHEPDLEDARRWIREAQTAYILGYGFDSTNSERIGLEALTARRIGGPRNVFFTNYRNPNAVNKRVGQLAGNYRFFLQDDTASDINGNLFEKSVRDVYEALELDFGMV